MKDKKPKKSFITRIVLIVVISVVFGFTLYEWNAKSLSGDVLPMPFGVGVGVVMSGSMEPIICVDDLIVVEKQNDYKVNDIVVFQQNGLLVVHKIISLDYEQGLVVTKGEANESEDPPMNISAIKGKVIKSYGQIGKVVKWIKSPLGTILILGVAGFLLVKSYKNEETTAQDSEKLEQIKKEIEELKNSSKR